MMTGTRSHATEANARKSVVALLDELEFNDGKLRSAAFGGAAEESCLDSKVDLHASDPPRALAHLSLRSSPAVRSGSGK